MKGRISMLLNHSSLRENFVLRVFVYARWQALRQQGLSKKGLLDFHTRHKLLLMAHSPFAYRELGRLLAQLDNGTLGELADRYVERVMEVLKAPASRKRHVNVLQHQHSIKSADMGFIHANQPAGILQGAFGSRIDIRIGNV
jgi:uncharacterized protein YbgA (DUF1722 family)